MADLEAQLRAIAEKHKANLSDVTRKAALSVAAQLIARSPVDTGRFRNNWMLGVDAPDKSIRTAVDTAGGDSMAGVEAGLRAWKAGQTIYITNNLPYAQRLEYGWSKQAPAGMVRIAVSEFQQIVKSAIGDAK